MSRVYQVHCPECGAYVTGFTEEQKGTFDLASCDDCGAEVPVNDSTVKLVREP